MRHFRCERRRRKLPRCDISSRREGEADLSRPVVPGLLPAGVGPGRRDHDPAGRARRESADSSGGARPRLLRTSRRYGGGSKGQPASIDAWARRLRRRDRASYERATHGDRPHDIAGQRAPRDQQGLRSAARNVAHDPAQDPKGAGRPRRTHRSLDASLWSEPPRVLARAKSLAAPAPSASPPRYGCRRAAKGRERAPVPSGRGTVGAPPPRTCPEPGRRRRRGIAARLRERVGCL